LPGSLAQQVLVTAFSATHLRAQLGNRHRAYHQPWPLLPDQLERIPDVVPTSRVAAFALDLRAALGVKLGNGLL
jgi:hypothetical protein